MSRVDEVLAAATAPPTGFELNREADMVALFRANRPAPVTISEGLTLMQIVRNRMAAAKITVAAGAAVLLAGGGVAFAASTGNLPEVLGGDHRSETGAKNSSQAPGQNKTPGQPSATPTSSAEGTPTEGPDATPSGTPTPSLKGLCNAFQAGAGDNPGKALDNPAFSALATAAGGKENIATYCVTLVGEPGTNPGKGPKDPSNGPTNPGNSDNAGNPGKPTTSPNANSTSKPGQTKSPNPNSTSNPSETKTPNPNKPTKTPAS